MGAHTSMGRAVWQMKVSTTCESKKLFLAVVGAYQTRRRQATGQQPERLAGAAPRGYALVGPLVGGGAQQAHLAQAAVLQLPSQPHMRDRVLQGNVHHHAGVVLQGQNKRRASCVSGHACSGLAWGGRGWPDPSDSTSTSPRDYPAPPAGSRRVCAPCRAPASQATPVATRSPCGPAAPV